MQLRVSSWGLRSVGRGPIYTHNGGLREEVLSKGAAETLVAAAGGKRGHVPRTTTMD